MNLNNAITDVPGIKVGHAQNEEALTGCTVILCEGGPVGGVDQRGGAPGTREIDALRPMHLVNQVHGVCLAGGSAFGLDAATGVVRYLEGKGVGFDTRVARVPIVPAAILFDLGLGQADVRPDAAMGYEASLNANSNPPMEGNVGAGMGATVGKILGLGQAMKSGIGTASMEIGEGLVVGAMTAVNAFGDAIDPSTGEIIAGARSEKFDQFRVGEKGYFADTLEVMKTLIGRSALGFSSRENTIIGVVATNARLTKEEVNKIAQMAHDGVARAIRPAHTMLDGDTIIALATGDYKADVNIVGAFAAEVVSQSIVRAVRTAEPVSDLPAASATEYS